MLFLGIWWIWIFTVWATNRLDPETTPVRLLLFALMAAGLFVTMAPRPSAGAAIQVGRSLFVLAVLWRRHISTSRPTAPRVLSSMPKDPGRIARLIYTYIHLPVAGGIIVSAAADEIVLDHPLKRAGIGPAAVRPLRQRSRSVPPPSRRSSLANSGARRPRS